jgi:choline kinase
VTTLVVLAAGLGRRLAAETARPKWLVPVNDATPAAVHLDAAASAGIERVVVVVSCGDRSIAAAVEPWNDALPIEIVPNDRSHDRNNWFSLLLGLQHWRGDGGDDVVVLNSDLIARPQWFTGLLAALRADEAPAALAVDRSRGRTEEAMKVGIDERGRIDSIGKVGVSDPAGEYVGMARWTLAAADELMELLRSFAPEPARADCWYEHAIAEHLRTGAEYAAVAVPSSRWVEIDDSRDLAVARALPGLADG